MNLAHLHLILNHLPIIGGFFGLAFIAYGYFMKNETIIAAAKVIFVFIAIMTIPVYFTGEPAEHIIEETVPGIDHAHIHEHQDGALYAFIAIGLLGVAALFSLVRKKSTPAINMGLLLGSILVFGLMSWVGYEGGQIQHQEIQSLESQPVKK